MSEQTEVETAPSAGRRSTDAVPHEAPEPVPVLSERARRDFAVVIPALDEAPVVPALIAELKATFDRHGLEGEIILVDDGSTDGTSEIALREAEGWRPFRLLRHARNRGKTEAMVTAAESTQRSVLVLFDADLQHTAEEIPRFLAKIDEGWEIVTGRKVGAYDKRAVSSVYNRLSRWIFRVPVSDLNSMKAFKTSILDAVPLRHDWHRFFVVLAHALGHSVTEIDVTLHPRRAGESKFRGPFRVLVGLLDLVSVWFLLWFSRKPLLLFGATGLALAGAGVLVGIVAFYYRFVLGQGFRPLLYLVVLLVTVGVLLFGFGLLAEMIAQLRVETDRIRRDVDRLPDRYPADPLGSGTPLEDR